MAFAFSGVVVPNATSIKTYVYVDGFNLYYGALKGTNYKWLNLATLCEHMLKEHEIKKIKYFTAIVSPREGDLDCHIRQQAYIRALKTIPNLEVHLGHFLVHVVNMRLAMPPNPKQPYAKVIKTEEKGSDVNLASHLLFDASKGNYDAAVVISNDSDLLTPIRMVKNDFGKKIIMLNPHKAVARALQGVATAYKPIRSTVLQLSQFPITITDKNGVVHKPESW